jgi:hypothetical protein
MELLKYIQELKELQKQQLLADLFKEVNKAMDKYKEEFISQFQFSGNTQVFGRLLNEERRYRLPNIDYDLER